MKFKRTEEEDYSLQLTPLIDVVFLLLIFFMVSTAFIDFTRQMEIELPDSTLGGAMEKTEVFEIEITAGRKIFLNGEKVDMESLRALLEMESNKMIKRSAVIRADKNAMHGMVVKVMEACKDSGITDIGVAVQ
ncbi:Biopolymer transport protein ExbD/TolR [hydrothermal vent metagenome]|uniref:Biopolymer transport protein ExbD/TolR n=1 Tax=hydrothermal vent metagenome TaxID=652676 RepID=A0A3B1BZE2_9ZZZZ